MRPDLGPSGDDLLERVVGANLTINLPEGWPKIFEYKIYVANAFAIAPYYIHDITFYGLREDLLKLANFDLSSEYICASLAPEQFFYRSPFAEGFPIFDAYLQAYSPLLFGEADLSRQRIDVFLSSDFYLDVFAAYMRLLSVYFHLGLYGSSGQPEALKNISLEDLLKGDVPGDGYNFLQGAFVATIDSQEVVTAVLTDGLKSSAVTSRLEAAVQRTADYNYLASFQANPLMPVEGAKALHEALAEFPMHSDTKYDRNADPEARHFKVFGHHDRINVTVDNDPIRDLEAELSRMRREIDQLRGINETA
ncbi:hypothetical protein AEYBE204_00010 [Asticcacaulis sp. YBE204]|nr:hypothetical protein AEYBE204_00010 [Asticcacaulis sp. YBE204]